jgi:hypothetical protein
LDAASRALRHLRRGIRRGTVSAVQKLSGAMQMSPAFALPFDLDALQHPRLQRSTKFLYGPEAIRVVSLLEFVERVQVWFLVELEYFVRPKSRYGEYFKHAKSCYGVITDTRLSLSIHTQSSGSGRNLWAGGQFFWG